MATSGARDGWRTMQRNLALRLSQRLFDEVCREAKAQNKTIGGPRIGWGLALAYSAAAAVYATSLVCGAAGILLLLGPWNTILTPLLAIALVALCAIARPRFAPSPDQLLSRLEYPTLHALSDRIAKAYGTPALDGIGLSADFGANYRRAGWRGRRYVELGAPLLAILTNAERVALIAHELSHDANRDPLRSHFLYGGAVGTLADWASALRPMTIGRLGDGLAFGPLISLIGIPFECLMLLLSELVLLFAKALLLLVFRQSQRAEYLADRLAASVAGSREMQATPEKTYLSDTVDAAIRHHAFHRPEDPIGDALVEAVGHVPSDDLDRLRAESNASRWQVDSTHPPTALRIALLDLVPQPGCTELLTRQELERLDVEVARLVASMQPELVNRRLDGAYG